MTEVNHYETLGISEKATQDEIKSAYRRLARQYHPDVNKEAGAEDRFKQIGAANDTLSNPQKRAEYDRSLRGGSGYQTQNTQGSYWGFHNEFHRMVVPNTPVIMRVEMAISDAFQDVRKKVSYHRTFGCTECTPKICNKCSGSGFHVRIHQQGSMYIQEQTLCPKCNGSRELRDASCQRCKGTGRYQEPHEVEVDLKVGSLLRGFVLEGFGNRESADQPPGALIIEVVPAPNSHYDFDKNHNLLYKYNVDPVQAILGGAIEVPLPEGGTTMVNLNPGCPEGHLEEIKEYGLPKSVAERGSLYVKVVYNLPKELSLEQETALRAYLEASETKIKKEG